MSDRSAAGSTVVWALAELLAVAGSCVLDATLAWFVIVPGLCGLTLTSAVALPLAASAPRGQVTVPDACEQVPWDGVADTNTTPTGRVSVRTTAAAPEGPAFWTVRRIGENSVG